MRTVGGVDGLSCSLATLDEETVGEISRQVWFGGRAVQCRQHSNGVWVRVNCLRAGIDVVASTAKLQAPSLGALTATPQRMMVATFTLIHIHVGVNCALIFVMLFMYCIAYVSHFE